MWQPELGLPDYRGVSATLNQLKSPYDDKPGNLRAPRGHALQCKPGHLLQHVRRSPSKSLNNEHINKPVISILLMLLGRITGLAQTIVKKEHANLEERRKAG